MAWRIGRVNEYAMPNANSVPTIATAIANISRSVRDDAADVSACVRNSKP
jgi:hypothetical protein